MNVETYSKSTIWWRLFDSYFEDMGYAAPIETDSCTVRKIVIRWLWMKFWDHPVLGTRIRPWMLALVMVFVVAALIVPQMVAQLLALAVMVTIFMGVAWAASAVFAFVLGTIAVSTRWVGSTLSEALYIVGVDYEGWWYRLPPVKSAMSAWNRLRARFGFWVWVVADLLVWVGIHWLVYRLWWGRIFFFLMVVDTVAVVMVIWIAVTVVLCVLYTRQFAQPTHAIVHQWYDELKSRYCRPVRWVDPEL